MRPSASETLMRAPIPSRLLFVPRSLRASQWFSFAVTLRSRRASEPMALMMTSTLPSLSKSAKAAPRWNAADWKSAPAVAETSSNRLPALRKTRFGQWGGYAQITADFGKVRGGEEQVLEPVIVEIEECGRPTGQTSRGGGETCAGCVIVEPLEPTEIPENLKRIVDHGGYDQIGVAVVVVDRKSTRLNSSHRCISYAVFC